MKNPLVAFILARLGIFALILGIFLLLQFDPIYSAVISAVLALAISLVFLQKQRDELSRYLYKRFRKDEFSGVADEDADLENRLLDRKEDDEEPKA